MGNVTTECFTKMNEVAQYQKIKKGDVQTCVVEGVEKKFAIRKILYFLVSRPSWRHRKGYANGKRN